MLPYDVDDVIADLAYVFGGQPLSVMAWGLAN